MCTHTHTQSTTKIKAFWLLLSSSHTYPPLTDEGVVTQIPTWILTYYARHGQWLAIANQVPIDDTAGWVASPVDTWPLGPHLNSGAMWVKFLAQGNKSNTKVATPGLKHEIFLSCTPHPPPRPPPHTHTHRHTHTHTHTTLHYTTLYIHRHTHTHIDTLHYTTLLHTHILHRTTYYSKYTTYTLTLVL